MAELQARMTSREFGAWLAFYQIQPFGPVWADFRQAALMALIAETNRDRKRRSRPYEPADFMPEGAASAEAGPTTTPKPDQVYAKVRAWAEGFKKHGNSE